MEDDSELEIIPEFQSTPLFKPEDWEKFLKDWRENVVPILKAQEGRLRACNPPA